MECSYKCTFLKDKCRQSLPQLSIMEQFPQISSSSHSQQQTNSHLPSIYQFYTLGISRYTEAVIKKMQIHFLASLPSESGLQLWQATKYHKLSNEELLRRGHFLYIMYQYTVVLKSIFYEINALKCSQEGKDSWDYENWLQSMVISIQELTLLSKLKHELCSIPLTNIPSFIQQLISLLFQTQIYVFQIFIRIYIYQIHKQQAESYELELLELKKKYKHISFNKQKDKGHKEEPEERQNKYECPLTKQQRRNKKTLWKQINKLLGFYQCDLSINRSDCRIKPELQCLLQLLKDKLSQTVFIELIENTTLKQIYQRTMISVKATNFTPFILVPLQADPDYPSPLKQNKLSLHKLQSLNFSFKHENSALNCRKAQQVITDTKQKIEDKQENNSNQDKLRSAQKSINTEEHQYGLQIERENTSKSDWARIEKNKEEQSKKKILGQKYKGHKGSITMTNLTSQQKLQFIGWNQRFSQNICNLTRRIVKVKKEKDIEYSESQKSQRYSREVCLSSKQPQLPYLASNYDSSEQMMLVLADQTPDEKRHSLIPPSQQS